MLDPSYVNKMVKKLPKHHAQNLLFGDYSLTALCSTDLINAGIYRNVPFSKWGVIYIIFGIVKILESQTEHPICLSQ